MTPIPGDPHKPRRQELTMGDGRKVKLKIPGLEPPAQPDAGDDRAAPEPLRDEPPTPTHPDVDPAA
jgi:hypothetical protein